MTSSSSGSSFSGRSPARRPGMPRVAVRTERLSSSYYAGLRVGFGVHDAAGEFLEIVDLGAHDWVAGLTGNRKHRFVASAIGIQLLPLLAP